MTILQKILFPDDEICSEKELYYRTVNSKVYYDSLNSTLCFNKDDIVNFNTYFNGFSIGKWKKYTNIKNVFLNLTFKGKFLIILENYELIDNKIVKKCVLQKEIFSKEKTETLFDYNNFYQRGMHSFIIISLEDNSVFYDAYYGTDENTDFTPKFALNICTYKREEYLLRNIQRLENNILTNKNSILFNKLNIYITDNAMTIDEDAFKSNYVHLTKQDAFGSVGGFTRGLINILNDKYLNSYDYVIFLDDDLTLDTRILERNYIFVQFIKNEYKDAWIGGAMLGVTWQNIQTESGGLIVGNNYKSLNCGVDLNNLFFVLRNNIEESAKINAWWYCCIPLSELSLSNLPYPMYFHADDMEFATRLCKKLILLNGLCVWHEEFFFKKDNFYYDCRNREILNALHFNDNCSLYKVIKRFTKRYAKQFLHYDYNAINDIVDGYMDFCKGAKKLIKIDEKNNFKKRNGNIVLINKDAYNLSDYSFNRSFEPKNKGRWKKLIALLTLNGFFLPANHNEVSLIYGGDYSKYYRAKRIVHYDPRTHKGYITQKSYLKSIVCIGSYFKAILILVFKYRFAVKSYKKSLKDYTTLEFWMSRFIQTNKRR